ncbi:MAG: T9SS type A sorting domain-containing protein [Flavobacteriales bacterium]|nr:T9SS type A sorting domain-containing protein [Flavobacteriales bacterium]
MRTPTLFAGLVVSIAAIAGTPPTPAMLENLSGASVGFEENKGQVCTVEGEPAPHVRYRLSQGNTQLFLLDNGIAYQFSRLHHPQRSQEAAPHARPDRAGAKQMGGDLRLETYRMDMVLEGADPNSRITTEGRSDDYTQYYNHEALDVHIYTKVTYHEIYPGIDWVVYTTEKGMKYDFVVQPGADPDHIRMRFIHHEELSLDAEGNLIHGNRMGRFTEERPVSFQDGNEVATSFVLEGNALRFALENYDRSRTLTIDPARLWATYYGGEGVDFGWSCTTDASGNVYMAGSAESSNGIAAGGHQNTYGDFRDAFLVKFTATGTRLWGTYYGGPEGEGGFQCAVDANGNVFLAGESYSSSAIASGGHQNAIGGDQDAFLAKFNAAGVRLWATYYGGTGHDRGLHCEVDAVGNVYLCGQTSSTSAMASGGHQDAYGGGMDDAFLAKFNPTGTRLWGTYYGGNAGDAGYSCTVDASGSVFLSGSTGSTSSIASSGHQNTLGGSYDAFLVKFTGSGSRIWGTYYGGTGGDQAWQCAVGTDGDVCLAGSTSSTTNIANGGHQNIYGGGTSDAFIAKFNTSGTRIWGSYYGGSDEDFAYSCAVDAAGSSYLTGFTSSTSGIAINGHQNTYGGGASDAFLVKLGANGDRAWGTYYGGTGFEGGFWEPTWFVSGRCTVDLSGNVLLAGISTSTMNISANGFQNTFGGDHDAFLVKFEDRSIATSVINGPICTGQAVSVPFTVSGAFNGGNTFTAELSDASGSFASPVDIGSLSGTGSGTISASVPLGTTPGSGYRIRVVGSNPIVEGTDNGTNLTINDRTTNCTCADVVESELNNTAATANAIAYDTPLSGITGPCSLPDNTVDHYSFTTTTQGVLRVEACLSNTGPAPLNVTFRVLNSAGTTLGTFILPAGANNVPVPGAFELPCRGIASYRIAVDNPSTVHCTNYAFSYTMLPPVFANDPEPNDGLGVSATQLAYNTDQDGRNNFDGESTYDYYRILLPTNGILNIDVQAEHSGAAPGTMTVALLSSGGTVLQTWPVAVGANSVPVSSTVSITCRSTVSNYHIRINSAVCGTSYRFKYTVTPPLFAGDVEPNNGTPGTTAAHDTYMDGNLQFDGESTYDYYNIVPPHNGVMTIEVQAEHVGASPATIDMVLYTTAGITIQTWSVPVGANSTATTTTVSILCRSSTTDYDLRFATTTCGVSYRWKYTMTAPFFANDLEPNNGGGGSTEAHDTWYEGQIGFDNQTDDDYYNLVPPFNGVMNVEIQAEHAGASPGTMEVELYTSAGISIQSWTVVAGASGVPVTTVVSVPCRSSTTDYDLRFRDVTCGVSYRWKYTMTAPFFANDLEPNQTYGGSTEADSTWYEGQLGFDNQTDDDIYNLVPAHNGVLNIEVEAEHTGASPGTFNVELLTTAGITIQSWTMVAGANGIPVSTTVSVPCRSFTTDYDLRFSDVTCGVSYRWKYTMTAPLFAIDAEPNETYGGSTEADSTWYEGQIGFDNQIDDDIYNLVPATNGVMHIEVQAEHTSASPGTMQVELFTTAGISIQAWTMVVGANGVPVTTAVSVPCRSHITDYDLRFRDVSCGVSYRWKYTMTPPLFAEDVEPNNTTPGTALAHNTYTEGHLAFDTESTYDYYRIMPDFNGMVNVELQAEHTGAVPGTITVLLLNTAGTTLQTWTFPVGANGVPDTTTFSRTCLNGGTSYDLRLASSVCGASYKLKYTLTPAVFTNDTEPNNSTSQAFVLPETQTAQGQLNFGSDNFDVYRANLSGDGVLNVTLEAEHADVQTNALVTVQLFISTGTVLQTWTAPIGAGSIPLSTVLSKTCLGNTLPYYLSVSSSICGTSYRISYTVTPPVFANDVEANDGGGLAHDTYAEGHLEFYNLGPYDTYNIVPPINGVMTFEVLAEHVGQVEGSMEVRLINTVGITIQVWTIPVGANGVPDTSTFSINCRGFTTDYDVRLSSATCGASYRWKYTMTAPVFPSDAEPNNQTPGGVGSPVAHDTYQNGHVEFDSQTDHDLYNIVPPTNGVMIFEVQAEHAGAVADSMELRLYTSAGITIQFWTIPVGANGVPVTSTFSIPCRTSTTDYDVRIISHACGTSYRWKYTMAAPVFANDVEPNGSTGQAIVLPVATPMTGQINFGGGENNDYYRINLPTDGVLNVTIEAEHSGASTTETVGARISVSTGTTLATWDAAVGASSTPASTSFSLSCRGMAVPYYLNLASNVCGASYRVSWTVTPPVYANDPEPNNSSPGTPMDLNAGEQQGHIAFYNTTDDDYYAFTHPGGPWSVTISAEHVGAGAGSMPLEVRNNPGTLFGSFTVPVGGSSTPVTTTFTIPSLAAGSIYRLIVKDGTCGVSYRIHCYDDDGDGTCNAFDLCAAGPEPGTPCDDNNGATTNDIILANCVCAGTLLANDCNGVPGGPALPGTACNDNNACTTGDVLDANCNCAGVIADADADGVCDANDDCASTPTGEGVNTDGCSCTQVTVDDGDPCTADICVNGSVTHPFEDTDNDGTCDANDICPGGPEPGTTCNDNNDCTTGDVIGTNCLCAGTFADADADGTCDANDLCPGGPEPGTTCNDNNGATINDIIQENCVCAGTLLGNDCNGVPGGPAIPGTTCNDNNPCTTGDVFDANCLCAGTFADADQDGTCDASDLCPGGPEPGTACNDNNSSTENDVVGSDCACAGTPTGITCTTDLDFVYQADGIDDLYWQLFEQGTNNPMQSGGGALIGNGSEATCLPDGCFYLVVSDSGGDGIVNGGYLLRINSSVRLIDNQYGIFGEGGFTSGANSQIDGNEGFCLPVGTDRLIFTSCDKRDWKTSPCGGEYVVANGNQDVSNEYGVNNANSGYQMWWFAPNGGYSFKRFQSHNTSNGLPASDTRACHFRINGWAGNQLQEGQFYNVKVRGRVNGDYNAWGPACRFMLNSAGAQCPRTKLMDLPGNQYLSCGQNRAIGNNVYVHAKPVRRMNNNCNWVNANRYQFRFRIPSENITIVKTSATGQYWVNTNGLTCGKTYEVDVRASFDNGATWCHSSDPYGDICLLTTTCSFGMAEESSSSAAGQSERSVGLYPNPNNGDQLFVSLSNVEEGVESINVDIYDSFGKRVAQRTIGVQDGLVNTTIDLNGELAGGMYMVSIAAGSAIHTERLVIQR